MADGIDRDARRAAALRENLRKRKEQARAGRVGDRPPSAALPADAAPQRRD